MNVNKHDHPKYLGVVVLVLFISAVTTTFQRNYFAVQAFIPPVITTCNRNRISPAVAFPAQTLRIRHPPIMATTTSPDEELEKEINAMKAKDIRQELQSYGISTKSFFEKSELVDALVAARKEGKTPTADAVSSESSTTASSETTATSSGSSSGSGANRQERLYQEIEKCKSMKVGELKKELESYGVPTKSFFEKSEFVRAVAEARVDGVKRTTSTGSSSSTGTKMEEEPRDPTFRDVAVSKFKGDKSLLGRGVIDVKAR